jgi:hypothetical protein
MVAKYTISSESLKHLVFLLKLFSNAFFTILFPILIYISIKNELSAGFENYLKRWDFLIIPIVGIGCISLMFLIFASIQHRYKVIWLFYSTMAQIVIIVQIFVWSNLLVVNFEINGYVIGINLSLFYIFSVILPVLLIIRNILIFHFGRKEFSLHALVLKSIYELKHPINKKQIKRYISNKLIVDHTIKRFILQNLSKILTSMLTQSKPLLKKGESYYLTKEGLSDLQYFESFLSTKKVHKDIEEMSNENLDFNNLEEWTEEELEKIKKRKT